MNFKGKRREKNEKKNLTLPPCTALTKKNIAKILTTRRKKFFSSCMMLHTTLKYSESIPHTGMQVARANLFIPVLTFVFIFKFDFFKFNYFKLIRNCFNW